MNRRLVVGCFLALSVGCGGTPTPPNDAASSTDANVDLSCVGSATVPAGAADTSAVVEVTEYVAMTPTRMTTIELFTNDAIMPPCTAPTCVSGVTDVMGHVTLSAPAGGWVGLHIVPAAPDCSGGTDQTSCDAIANCAWSGTTCDVSPDTAEVLAYNQTWPSTAGDTLGTYAFSSSSIGLVSSLLGRTFQTATAGAISGQVNDCAGHTVANAEPRVYQGSTLIMSGATSDRTSPRITGLSGTSPTRNGLTGSGGTFVGANVPPGDDYHVEIWSSDTGTDRLIGCEEGRVVAGAITVLVIGPLRSDYAAGSACAMAAAAAGH